jgi:hypothetical protein
MSAQFLHLYVNLQQGKTRGELEVKLDKALDWFRYHEGLYVLYTTTDSETWKERLLELVKPDGSLFICPLDIQGYKGWMTKDFWEWIRKEGRAQ